MCAVLQSGEAVVIFATFQNKQNDECAGDMRVDKLLIGDEHRLNEALSFDDRFLFERLLHIHVYIGVLIVGVKRCKVASN